MNAHARIRTIAITALLFLLPLPLLSQAKQELKLKTVVLDAGHGGNDSGAVSQDGKTKEKDLTLAISKRVGALIKEAYPDVKIVYTRPDDKFVTLQDRADIANRNQANLFISIHINSFTSKVPDGFSTHILGESSKKNTDLFAYNMNVCRRENSVILLEDDYSTRYQGFNPEDPESFIFFHLMQNAFYEQSLLFAADVQSEMRKGSGLASDRGIHQDPFYVLWRTTMPSVLIENGFISNANDLAVLRTDKGIEDISVSIFKAFAKFKARYDGSTDFVTASAEIPSQTQTGKAEPDVVKPTTPQAGKPEADVVKPTTPQTEKPEADVVKPTTPQTGKPEPEGDVKGTRYGIQVVVSSRVLQDDDPFFSGSPVTRYPAGMLNKYVIYEQDEEAEVRKIWTEVKKNFPDSFIVKIEGNKIISAIRK